MKFVIHTFANKYSISTKNKKKFNFEIIDRIVRGICIQTQVTNKRLLPVNLWPIKTTKLYPNSIDGSIRTISRIKNRSIYKTGERYIDSKEERIIKWQLKDLGLPIYNEKKFYQVFRMSRKDTIDMVKMNKD